MMAGLKGREFLNMFVVTAELHEVEVFTLTRLIFRGTIFLKL
jgi:hypothetical protein